MYPVHDRPRMVRRALSHLARTPIDRFPTGPGATSGRITAVPRPIQLPLDGDPCTGYAVAVYWLTEDDRWIPFIYEWRCADFELTDATGTARFAGDGADVAFGYTDTRYAWTSSHMFPAAYALLARYGHPHRGVPLLFEQSVLHIGQQVAVCGVGAREPTRGTASAGYRQQAATRLVIERHPRFPLAVTNHIELVRARGDIPARYV